ncbi:MAG: ATP-binding cassette domain-containing protein [Acidobacteria bacterium]|nr:ATP-binding cassette domain-containing protein [Acidobacteriota bacterium]
MIKVEGLTKRYARNVAVNNISFEVEKGQIVGFLGPNGAGKTTTMRILTCFLPATSGKASVAGFDCLEQADEVKKRIGYLPETPPLYPEMEVAEYLEFVGRLKGIDKASLPSRVDEVLEKLSLVPERKKLISKLSKGYRQRVGIAQAIIHNPEVLILDEPTSGLDPKQIIEVRDLIRALAGDHTIILSTHILQEVEAMCERVIIISQGRVVATDSMASLANQMRGSESVTVQVDGRGSGAPDENQVRQKLESVAGVARVSTQGSKNGLLTFQVDSLKDRSVRADVARAVVGAGWNLLELHTASLGLEEIFLQLTASNDGGKQ